MRARKNHFPFAFAQLREQDILTSRLDLFTYFFFLFYMFSEDMDP